MRIIPLEIATKMWGVQGRFQGREFISPTNGATCHSAELPGVMNAKHIKDGGEHLKGREWAVTHSWRVILKTQFRCDSSWSHQAFGLTQFLTHGVFSLASKISPAPHLCPASQSSRVRNVKSCTAEKVT